MKKRMTCEMIKMTNQSNVFIRSYIILLVEPWKVFHKSARLE